MALQVNTFLKQQVILGCVAARLATSHVIYFYSASTPMPALTGTSTPGFIASVNVPANAVTRTAGQIKLNQVINFTPTASGTPVWADSFANPAHMYTDSIVANGQVGLIVLSTLTFVAGQQATLLDFTLNIS